MKSLALAFVLLSIFGSIAAGQTLQTRPPEPVPETPAPPAQTKPNMIPLTVPAGTPLKIALDEEVRIHHAGQPIHGRTTEPVYVFDKLVIPAGSQVGGKISEVEVVSKTRRTLDALNGDFSPPHRVHVSFDELILPDGRHMAVDTVVSPSSSSALSFVPAANNQKSGLKQQG